MAEIRVFPTPNIPVSTFVHLHVHSDYSLKTGSSSLYSLVAKAKSLNMKALALTDTNNLIGAVNFEKICRANGINPVIGEDIVVCDEEDFFNLVLLCKDLTGYKNLCKLSGITYSKKFTARKHFVPIEDLKDYSEGLICLSGGKKGAFHNLILQGKIQDAEQRAVQLRKIFRENFYIELQNHGLAEETSVINQLEQISRNLHIPTVLTNEVNYCNKKDADSNEILKSIRSRTPYNGEPANHEWYLKSEQQMKEYFPSYSEAYNNAAIIAAKCNLHIPTVPKTELKDYLPQIVPPQDFCIYPTQKENQQELMRRLVNAGLKNRYKYISDKIRERADAELDLIYKKDFTNFLLMIWEYVNWAKEQDIITGFGKGSITESIIAYALEITDIDPLKYDLPFERFINEDTTSLPDIDIEFGSEKIVRLMQHIKALYGEKKVANIMSVKNYKGENLKTLLEDIGHAIGIDPKEIQELTSKLPKGKFYRLKDAFTEPTEFTQDNGQLIPYRNDPRYTKLFSTAFKLEGCISRFSMHRSGIVISKNDLSTIIPVCSDPKTEELVTQYTVDHLPECGLYTFDFIDSLTETFIRKCEDMIIKNHPGDKFNINQIPLYDDQTYQFFSSGETEDIPGFKNAETQEILKNLKPNNFDELTALYTMNRPGQSNQIRNYINRKENPSLIEYPDLSLKNILKETYGLVIYQEQMMYCLQQLSGKSLGEVNKLRHIMNKQNVSYESMRADFIAKIIENGFDQDTAEKLFNRIAMTSTFCYLKADAISATRTSYLIAWIKVHYPEEFNGAKNTMSMKHWWENYYMEI